MSALYLTSLDDKGLVYYHKFDFEQKHYVKVTACRDIYTIEINKRDMTQLRNVYENIYRNGAICTEGGFIDAICDAKNVINQL